MTGWRLSRRAKADIDDIWTDTEARWSERQADAYVADIARAFDRLAMFPMSAREVGDIKPGYRALPVGMHTVYFTADGDDILIVRVLHQRMDPDGQF